MRWLACLLVMTSSCTVDLDASRVAIVCDEDADCPEGRCEVSIQRCVGSGTGTPLRLTSAVAVSSVRVDAVFNQEVAPGSIVELSQATIDPPLAVTGFELDETQRRLSLTTETQAFDVVYTVTVRGLVGGAGDPLDEAARSQSFVSFQGLADRSPPAIIRPAAGSLVVGGNVAFAWQAIPKVGSYAIEVQRRGDPGSPIVVEIPATETTTEINVPVEGTYDWRIRADVTEAGVYSTAAFDAVVDAVYVSCPGGDCEPRRGNGSKRLPVERIDEGLVLARQLGIGTVRIAARGDGSSYDELVVLSDSPVTIDGGFDASFTAGAGRAEISALGTVLVVRPASGPTRLAHVTISAAASPSLQAISVEGPVDFTLDDVVIRAESPIDTNVGIACDGRPGIADVHVANVTMLLDGPELPIRQTSRVVAGIRARDVKLDIRDSLLSVALSPDFAQPLEARGIDLLGSSSISASRIAVGVGSAIDTSTAFSDDRESRPAGAPAVDVIDASRFWVSLANAAAVTVELNGPREVVIRNSVIFAGPSGVSSEAVRIGAAPDGGVGPWLVHDLVQVDSDGPAVVVNALTRSGIIANSIITSTPCTRACGPSPNSCIATNSDVGPVMVAGSALACPAPYFGFGLGSPDFTQPSPSCADNQGRVIRCNGTSVVAPPLDAYFADVDGPDGDRSAPVDNDYHLIAGAPAILRSGGLDLAGNVCGYADQALPCYAGSLDADGAPRTAPFSIGPYEY